MSSQWGIWVHRGENWFWGSGVKKNLTYYNCLWPSKGLQKTNIYVIVLKFNGRNAIRGKNVQKVFLGMVLKLRVKSIGLKVLII